MQCDVNQPLTGTMRDHLDCVIAKIKASTPFGLIRPSDGEHKILTLSEGSFTNCDQWTFRAGGKLQSQLLTSIQTVDENLYIGIPCNTCNKPWNCTQEIYSDFISRFKVPLRRRTYANLFGNSNWRPFIDFLTNHRPGFHLVTSGDRTESALPIRERHLIDAQLVDDWDVQAESETERLLQFVSTKSRELILFSAGPLSKIWIPICMKAYPNNMYVDVGASLDHFSKGTASRFYVDETHPFSQESCLFNDGAPGREPTHQNLVYVCVFLAEGYVQLLELLLRSIQRFSIRQNFDVLVMTSTDLEPMVKAAASKLNFPISVMTASCSNVFQATCARINIFDYEGVDRYQTLLYLDTDILITGELSNLFDLQIDDKLYGCAGAHVGLPNFGKQFFDFTTIDQKTIGINSGTLLFKNSENMRGLFSRIRTHMESFAAEGKQVPYALDQPFINYHAVKDDLYDHQLLTPCVALFETDDCPTNRANAIVWHFSFPLGNWVHKQRRMVRHWVALLNRRSAPTDVSAVTADVLARRLKIAVYAIALNEEKHVHSWCDSVTDADYVVVADTGSVDRTVDFLKARGVSVHSIEVTPWRFDEARNRSMTLVPDDADVCICLDMDEFMLPGWRGRIEGLWKADTHQLAYQFAPDFGVDVASMRVYEKEKIHARRGFQWFRPVHEALRCEVSDYQRVVTKALLIGQIQDKHKSRSSYLPLMQVAREEDPQDAQLCFWLGREQVYAGQLVEAAETLKAYLDLSTGNAVERSEVLRFLAHAEPEDAPSWLHRALAEAGLRREIWRDLARYYYDKRDWVNLLWAAVNGLAKSRQLGIYLDDPSAWDHALHDFASLAYGELGSYARAIDSCREALKISPKDTRLAHNLAYFETKQAESVRPKHLGSEPFTRGLGDISRIIEHAVRGLGSGTVSNDSAASQEWRVHVVAPMGIIGANSFTPLVQAVAYGLSALGVRVVVTIGLEQLTTRSVLIGANLLSPDDMTRVPSGTIIYNAEHSRSWWLSQMTSVSQQPYRELLARSVVWDVSAENARELATQLKNSVRYVPLGYASVWSQIPRSPVQDIDVLFYGMSHPRRLAILQRLAAAGLTVMALADVYSEERDALIARAKVVIVIAYWLPARFDSVRINYLLANQKAVIRECNPGEETSGDLMGGMVETPYESLVEKALELVKDEPRRRALEKAGLEHLAKRDQRAIMQAALADVGRAESMP